MKTILFLGFGTFVFVACSNGSSTNDAGADAASDASQDASVSATQACTDEANALCALRDGCSDGFNNALDFGSATVCQSRTAQTCINALGAKGTGNNPTLVEACAAAYPDEACSDFFDGNPVTACVPATGTLATGTACGASAQCASTYCAIAADAICGTCQPLPVAGASCEVQADCGRDLACATPTLAQGDAGIPAPKCAAWMTSGNACLTGYQPCQQGLSCVGDDEATMKTGSCQPSGATVSAPCDATRKTMAGCEAELGLVCVPTAKGSGVGTCQKVSLVAANAACGDVGSMPITGFASCEAGGLCKKAVVTDTTGTCVAPAADGAACDNDVTKGPPCLAPAKCVVSGTGTAGTCTVPNASTCM